MRIVCLWFPRLSLQLTLRNRPTLAGRPIVIVQGHGDAALVVDRCVVSANDGVLPGMPGVHARLRCPDAAFVPDNATDCLEELERLAGIIARRGDGRVEVAGRDHLFVAIDARDDDAAGTLARALVATARNWTGLEVRAGCAPGRADALDAARAARRGIVLVPGEAEPETIPPFRPEEIAGGTASPGGEPMTALAARAALVRLLSRLNRILEARRASYREASLVIQSENPFEAKVRTGQPSHAAGDVLALLAGAGLTARDLDGATSIRVELKKLGPDVRVRPLGRRVSPVAMDRLSLPRAS